MTDSQPRYTTKRLLDKIAKARAYGLELAAQLIDENVIQDTSAGKVLAPRQEGNRDGQHYAVSIRALIPSPSPTATASTEVDVKTDRDLRETDHKTEREDDVAPHAAAIPPLGAEAKSPTPQDQMTGDIEAAPTAAIKAAQDEITIDRIESSDNQSDMIRTAFIGAISSAILAERQRCAKIASSEAINRLNNEDGYPAARAHDFVVVARKIEREILKGDSLDATRGLPEILPGPRDQSDRAGKRDRQRLQSAFKKGVKEGRRIEREAHQVHISTIAGQIKEQDSRDD